MSIPKEGQVRPKACPPLSSHLSLTRDGNSDQNTLPVSFYPLFPQVAWKTPFGICFWGSELESVQPKASPCLCHCQDASPDWCEYIPTSLSSIDSKQHLLKEQHGVLLFWHVSLQIVELKAKDLKGIIEKANFLSLLFSRPLSWHTMEGQPSGIILPRLWTVSFVCKNKNIQRGVGGP